MNFNRMNIPPVYLFSSIVVMILFHFYHPLRSIIDYPFKYIGLVIVVLGFGIIVWKATLFKKYKTPIRPFETSTYLIIDGLYRYSRNPIYLAMVIILLGGAVFLGSLTPFFVIPVFMFFIAKVFIENEEKFLENIFGKEYLDYKKTVRRWI